MSKTLNKQELLLTMYLSFGMLKSIPIFNYIDYILSLILQIITILSIIKKKDASKKIIYLYITILFLLILITINFINLGVDINKIINRILPLLSVFGIIIISENKKINIEKVLNKTKKFYFILGIILILNTVSYFILNISLWYPDRYLGFRFKGPFYDANFLSITYSVMLILILFNKEKLNIKKVSYLIVYAICIFLGLSWSAIIILLISILLSYILKNKNMFLKQLLFLIGYVLVIYLITKYNIEIKNTFYSILENYTNFSKLEIIAKYNSFYYRVLAQIEAINLFIVKPFGYGPLQLVLYLGRDVHNSYIAFWFEMGIVGLILQLIVFTQKIDKKDKMLNVLSSFIFLISLTINIHYTIMFSLLLILTYKKKEYENEKDIVCCR